MSDIENTISVMLSTDIQLIGERSRTGHYEATLTVRQRHSDQLWTDLRLKRNEKDLAEACELLRRFYSREQLT